MIHTWSNNRRRVGKHRLQFWALGTNGGVCWPSYFQFLVCLSQVGLSYGRCYSMYSRVKNSEVQCSFHLNYVLPHFSSGLRTKELKMIIPRMKSFPVHHEVRFAQHLIQLCEAVLSNIDGCRLHCMKIVDAPREEYDGKEKDKARGFLKTWHSSSLSCGYLLRFQLPRKRRQKKTSSFRMF